MVGEAIIFDDPACAAVAASAQRRPVFGAARARVRQRTDQPQAEAMRRKNSKPTRTPMGDIFQGVLNVIPFFNLIQNNFLWH